MDDTPRVFAGGYQPGNAGGNYYGEVTLREALSRSLNVATVDLAETVGVAALRAQLERFGISPAERDADLALALGSMTEGVSPARLCAAYCALANGGRRVEPHTVRKIVSSDGEVLYEAPQAEERAVSAETACMLTDMLRTAAAEGSANALSAVGANVAGKTGTVDMESGGNRDAWTVAYTPKLAVAVWMGFDEPDAEHSLPDWAGGSSYPARLCANFLSSAGERWLRGGFATPDTLRRVVIDALALEEDKTVALAAERTPEKYLQTELFYAGREPQAVSGKWDAPEPVTDLELVSAPGETPVLRFTARDENAEYLLIRHTDGRAEEVAVLRGEAGEVLQYTDGAADLSQIHEYSIIPRHALLYEEGETVTGAESLRVRYTPGGLLGHIEEMLSPGRDRGARPGSRGGSVVVLVGRLGGSRLLLPGQRRKDELAILRGHGDAVAELDLAIEYLLAEGVLHHALDGAAQRARAVLQVVPGGAEQLEGGIVHFQVDVALAQALLHVGEHQRGDAVDLLLLEGVEDDDLVHAVQELGAEDALDLVHDVLAHGLVALFIAGAAAKAHGALLFDGMRAGVAGHDHHGVLKVHHAALTVGEAAVLEDLQKHVEHVRDAPFPPRRRV